MLDIITNADNEIYEDNLLMITDAYQCLMAIVIARDKGRNAFVGNRGIHYLCETVIRQTFRCEDALKVSGSYGQFSRDAEKVNKLDLEKMIICTNTISKTVFKYSFPSCFYIY